MISPKQKTRMDRRRYRRLRRFIRKNLGEKTYNSWIKCVKGYTPQDAERLLVSWLYKYIVPHTVVSTAISKSWK